MVNHEYENREYDWVEARVASLESAGAVAPDAGVVLNRLRSRRRARGMAIRRWLWTTSVATAAGIGLLVVPASRACAEQPGKCVQKMLGLTEAESSGARVTGALQAHKEEAPVLMAAAEPDPTTDKLTRDQRKTPAVAAPAARANFKSEGAADAPVTVEIYIDYDCVHCATFVREVLPELRRQYVATGQMRVLWRDFPLPPHRFARLAARYADAAGALGYYRVVMEQIFDTREEWDVSGDVDGAVAKVLPAEVMAQVRAHLETAAAIDAGLEADRAAAEVDRLNHTPFAVLVRGGTRSPIAEAPLSLETITKEVLKY